MKRSPLRRTSTLKRSPMRRKRGSTKYARRERDVPRMLWCKTLPCMLAEFQIPFAELWHGSYIDGCSGPIEAHHAGEHGLSNKAPDNTVAPLCDRHHDCLTDRMGAFAGWPKYSLKLWELAAIAHYQALYAARSSGSSGELW